MKFFRKHTLIILSTLFFLTSIYISIYGLFYLTYSKPPNIPFFRSINTSNILYRASESLLNSGFGNLYFFNSGVVFNDSPDFVLRFSKKDYEYKDSIRNLIKSGKVKILEDWLKKWRDFEIVVNGEEIDAKFKYHGSSYTPYLQDYESFTVKSEFPINGYTNFKLINGLETNYFNVFLNLIGHNFNLITEDPGRIIVTNSLGKIQDFFQYNVFDEAYLQSRYGFKNSIILRRNTFWENNNNSKWHSSKLDNVPYNIDLNYVSNDDYVLWESLLNSTSENNYDPEYIGMFLALLQLFGSAHQITGNNDKWVINNGKLYPVYRNESALDPIINDEININSLFSKYYYSYSLEPYKSFLGDENVLIERNHAFKKILDSRINILDALDSTYNQHIRTHRRYNKKYLKIKFDHNNKKRVLENNLNKIENYLNSGHSLILFDGEKLKVSSTRKNPIKVEINGEGFTFLPKRYFYNKEELSIKDGFDELIIDNIEVIDSLKLYDITLDKILEVEKDYSILYIN
tara:strand:+ start:912 stop:2459 length:1548 start_codon:yes stop_codon:yes gene_type:complete